MTFTICQEQKNWPPSVPLIDNISTTGQASIVRLSLLARIVSSDLHSASVQIFAPRLHHGPS